MPPVAATARPRAFILGDLCVDYYATFHRIFPGGQAFNFAAHVRRLGFRASLASCVGDDFWGNWLLDRVALAGVDSSTVERRPGRSFVTRVEHVSGVERVFAVEDEGTTAGWSVSDDALRAARRARLVYATPWARAGTRLALATGPRDQVIAFDCMDVAPDGPLPPELQAVRIAFLPVKADGVAALVGRILAAGPEVVVASRGAAGSAVYGRGGLISERPPDPSAVVDTLGAGDALAAAFCDAYVRGHDIQRAHELASAYAAWACSYFGGTLGPRGEWDTRLPLPARVPQVVPPLAR